MNTIEKLEKTGFKKAVEKIKGLKIVRAKMAVAYEHYRFVKQEKINDFNAELKKESKDPYRYKSLQFTSLDNYEEAPPLNVLEEIEKAQELKCFDYFEIAQIKEVVVDPDPIVFGRINKCPDRFFIAQWDNDVNISQILKENEG